MQGDYVKLNRNILNWEWWSDIKTCRLFIYCLLKANWKDAKFRGTDVKRGSFVSSVAKMSCETQLSEREIRTALNHLKSTGEVTSKSTSKYTIFTVVNYDLYQESDKQTDRQETNKRQTKDKQETTIEERKNNKNNKKESKEKKNTHGEYMHVRLTDDEFEKLKADYGEADTLEAVKLLDEYIEMKGYKANSHYLALRKWVYRALEEQRQKDAGKPDRAKNKGGRPNRFNGFEQREYDYDAYEADILNSQKGLI